MRPRPRLPPVTIAILVSDLRIFFGDILCSNICFLSTEYVRASAGVNAGTLLILAYSCFKTYIEASVQKGVDMSDPLIEAVYRYTNAQKKSGAFATAIDALTILRSNQ